MIDEEAAALLGDGSGDAGEAARVRAEDNVGAAVGAEGAIYVGASHGIARVVVAFEDELASLAVDAKGGAGVGVGDEHADTGVGLAAHRGVFAAQGEGEADGDFHFSRRRDPSLLSMMAHGSASGVMALSRIVLW